MTLPILGVVFAVLLLVAVLGGLLLYSAVWELSRSSGKDTVQDDEGSWFPSEFELGFKKEPFVQTGSLPMSSTIQGTFVRWHNPCFFYTGEPFWRTFQDGPWKWDEQQRYAGKGINCGHYFALDRDGAKAEARFYGLDLQKYSLLEVDAQFDAILDLTYEDHLVVLAKEAISNIGALYDRSALMQILSFLVGYERGGNGLTDFIGWWAHRRGYQGILFFGARALELFPEFRWQIENGQDEGMAGPVAPGYFHRMRQQPALKNLVVFSGSRLTRQIEAYRLSPHERTANTLSSAGESEIDALLQYNAEYQNDRGSVFYLAKPIQLG